MDAAALIDSVRVPGLTMLALFASWRLFFWDRYAPYCGYCGSRRQDMHAEDCPWRKDGES